MSIYDFVVKKIDGEEVSLSEYKDKVLLIVNTATHWGLTPQYEGLEELYSKYKNDGFEILDFPCNQFKGQAPGTDKDVYDFVQKNYNTTFQMFSKINVNGEDEDPLYSWLKSKKPGEEGEDISWNFAKFLIDREGNVIERFEPAITPEELEERIKSIL